MTVGPPRRHRPQSSKALSRNRAQVWRGKGARVGCKGHLGPKKSPAARRARNANAQCCHHTATGRRCRSARSSPESCLCPRHRATEQKLASAEPDDITPEFTDLKSPCKPSRAFTPRSPNFTSSSPRTASRRGALPCWPTSPACFAARSPSPKRTRQNRSLASESSHCLCLLVKLKFWFNTAPLPPCFYERVRTQLKTVELSFALALKNERRERHTRRSLRNCGSGTKGRVPVSYERVAQNSIFVNNDYCVVLGSNVVRGASGPKFAVWG